VRTERGMDFGGCRGDGKTAFTAVKDKNDKNNNQEQQQPPEPAKIGRFEFTWCGYNSRESGSGRVEAGVGAAAAVGISNAQRVAAIATKADQGRVASVVAAAGLDAGFWLDQENSGLGGGRKSNSYQSGSRTGGRRDSHEGFGSRSGAGFTGWTWRKNTGRSRRSAGAIFTGRA
jgi:hypothetical protein